MSSVHTSFLSLSVTSISSSLGSALVQEPSIMSYIERDEEYARQLRSELNTNPKRAATRNSATTSTPSAPRTTRVSKKPPPNSSKYAEPRPSPHDSGFSEVASTDDEQVLSDFTPPSSSSSDSPQESSVTSPSSPEEDPEEDIVEPSSPEVSIHKSSLTPLEDLYMLACLFL